MLNYALFDQFLRSIALTATKTELLKFERSAYNAAVLLETMQVTPLRSLSVKPVTGSSNPPGLLRQLSRAETSLGLKFLSQVCYQFSTTGPTQPTRLYRTTLVPEDKVASLSHTGDFRWGHIRPYSSWSDSKSVFRNHALVKTRRNAVPTTGANLVDVKISTSEIAGKIVWHHEKGADVVQMRDYVNLLVASSYEMRKDPEVAEARQNLGRIQAALNTLMYPIHSYTEAEREVILFHPDGLMVSRVKP